MADPSLIGSRMGFIFIFTWKVLKQYGISDKKVSNNRLMTDFCEE